MVRVEQRLKRIERGLESEVVRAVKGLVEHIECYPIESQHSFWRVLYNGMPADDSDLQTLCGGRVQADCDDWTQAQVIAAKVPVGLLSRLNKYFRYNLLTEMGQDGSE